MIPTHQARAAQTNNPKEEAPQPGASADVRNPIQEPESEGAIVSLAERRRMKGAKKGMFHVGRFSCWMTGSKATTLNW